eukprot:m.196146 g.196146  ORF g.196146 m.196146 type:complete len:510 (+) comp32608_c0_seq1:485-2014(+)
MIIPKKGHHLSGMMLQTVVVMTTFLIGAVFCEQPIPISFEAMSSNGDVAEANTALPENLEYAKIALSKVHVNGSQTHIHAISGVFALYSPADPMEGVLVVANPIDACGPLTIPSHVQGKKFILLARLDSASSCTALEQGQFAEKSGALGLLNMAPQRTSYIYLLEKTREQINVAPASIPQVAISGSSGWLFLTEVIRNKDNYVRITTSDMPSEADDLIDLVVAVSCMLIAVLVLLYAYRVGRNLCKPPPPPVVDEEETMEHRLACMERMKKILKNSIEIVEYKETEEEEPCAICLEPLETGSEVRVLWCKHLFHVECIDPWLLNRQTCPLCKDNVLQRAEDMADMNEDPQISKLVGTTPATSTGSDALSEGPNVRIHSQLRQNVTDFGGRPYLPAIDDDGTISECSSTTTNPAFEMNNEVTETSLSHIIANFDDSQSPRSNASLDVQHTDASSSHTTIIEPIVLVSATASGGGGKGPKKKRGKYNGKRIAASQSNSSLSTMSLSNNSDA